MARTTIDFGIYLGTSNSSIAVCNDGAVEVFRNDEGSDYTPSVGWVNKNNTSLVDREAKEHLEEDPENAISIQNLIGSDYVTTFRRVGRTLSPEGLLAEVLQELKMNVKKSINEEVASAVITVPTYFVLSQCRAIRRAARLAGINDVHLLREPVAAGLASGILSRPDNTFWLIYDLSSSAFNATVIRLRDGTLEIVNDGGDLLLGEKYITWTIIEEILLPALIKQCHIPDIKRGNVKWRSAFLLLKQHTGKAMIALSHQDSYKISIDFSQNENFPEPFTFNYELRYSELVTISGPFIKKTISVCNRIIAKKGLVASNIEKAILVGNPTLERYLREQLLDQNDGLGIPLDWMIDPTTIIVRGAALYAHTQKYSTSASQTSLQSIGIALPNNEYAILLKRGTPLPAHERIILRTSAAFHKGQKEDFFCTAIMEGENSKADRNLQIATIRIPAKLVNRETPYDSEIEITVDFDESRQMETSVYIPINEDEFDIVVSNEADHFVFRPKELKQELKKEKQRFYSLEEKAIRYGDEHALSVLQNIKTDELVSLAETALASIINNYESVLKFQKLLLNLRIGIDSLEDSLNFVELVQDAEKLVEMGQTIAQQNGNIEEKSRIETEETQLRAAINSLDQNLLIKQFENYRMAMLQIMKRTGLLATLFFQYLQERQMDMSDKQYANQLISEGLRAMNSNNVEQLESINRKLIDLLPLPTFRYTFNDFLKGQNKEH